MTDKQKAIKKAYDEITAQAAKIYGNDWTYSDLMKFSRFTKLEKDMQKSIDAMYKEIRGLIETDLEINYIESATTEYEGLTKLGLKIPSIKKIYNAKAAIEVPFGGVVWYERLGQNADEVLVDLSDENFANQQSALAMAWKILIMDQITTNKERKFKKGLQRRLELICNYLNFRGASFNYLDISLKFERNKPLDELAKVQIALMLNGFVSKETALSSLPSSIVPDITEELRRLEDEADAYTGSTFLEETEVTADDGQTKSD